MSGSKPRKYIYSGSGTKYTSIQCRKCDETKPVWYFGIRSETGERRKICKACRARLRHRTRISADKRFEGVFDGLDLNPLWDLNSNEAARDMIVRRARAVGNLVLKEMKERKQPCTHTGRTIADEIKAGKKAWRAIRRLARAPIPLNLPESD